MFPDEVVDGHLRIAGERMPAADAASYDIFSPVTGKLCGRMPRAGVVDVDLAVAAAAAAFQANLRHSPFVRADWCHAIAAVIEDRLPHLSRALSLEHGKPLAQAELEVSSAAEGFRLAAEEAKRMGGATMPVRDSTKLVLTVRKPRGVFAVMTPTNFPVNIPIEYIGPLLACGNAMVWKPSATTSGIAHAIMDCIDAARVPPGLVNLVTSPEVQPAQFLVSHPDVAGVCFTGSSVAGIAVARAASGKTQLMELGGNGPIVVLPDADLDRAAECAASAAFTNSGQSCAAAGRIIVAAEVADDFVERLLHWTSLQVVGSPFVAESTMGPVHTAAIAETMARHLDDAVRSGALVLAGGRHLGDHPTDLYWLPTVLDQVPAASAVMAEETFGPLAPVRRVAGGVDALVAEANSGTYGLSAAVFGESLERTLAVASRLRSGQVAINDTSNYWELHMPFGGAAGTASGQGRIGGRYAAEAVTDLQSLSVTITVPWH